MKKVKLISSIASFSIIPLACLPFTSCSCKTQEEQKVHVESIQIESDYVQKHGYGFVRMNKTQQVPFKVLPENASDKTLTWSSSDTTVATVDAEGIVTGVKMGYSKITATANDGGIKKELDVYVTSEEYTRITSITMDATAFMDLGSEITMTAKVLPENATHKDLLWTSSDTNVATIDQYSGKVSAKKAGTTTITAQSILQEDKKATCTLTVTVPKPTKVELVTHKLSMEIGQKPFQMKYSVLPEQASQDVVWTTDNKSVAIVDSNGLITPKGVGSTILTCASKVNGKKDTCSINVYDKIVHVTSVEFDKTTLSLKAKENDSLTVTVKPTDATNKNYWISSSDKSIVSFEDTGTGTVTVKALKQGEATLTVTTVDQAKTAECKVTVDYATPTKISLNLSTLQLNKGATFQLLSKVLPIQASQSVTWSSSDDTVATVNNGLVTAANKDGTATITCATVADPSITAQCTVTVATPVTPVESITLDKHELKLASGGSDTLTATILPESATVKTYKFTSDNEETATVDETSGLVTAIKPGTANITVTSTDGGKTDTCVVTVTKPAPESIKLNRESIEMYPSTTVKVEAEVLPQYSSQDVGWYSTNENVAIVDDNGRITSISEGIASIVCYSEEDLMVYNYVSITVIPRYIPVESVKLSVNELKLLPTKVGYLTYSVTPQAATYPDCYFESDNWLVASTTNRGRVTARLPGTATITCANVFDPTIKDTCKVTVDTIHPSSVTVDPSELNLECLEKAKITAKVLPENAFDKSVTWSSSDETIATVDENGVVKALVADKDVTITATTNDGGLKASCKVHTLQPKFESASWETISEAAKGGLDNLKKVFSCNTFIGLERSVILNGLEHKVRVIGENHDITTTGEKTALTFELVTLLSDQQGFGITSILCTKESFEKYDQGTLYKMLNTNLEDPEAIDYQLKYNNKIDFKRVTKQVSDWIDDYTWGTKDYQCSLFPLTCYEIGVQPKQKEGKLYEYWQKHASDEDRIKKDYNGKISGYLATTLRNTINAWFISSSGGWGQVMPPYKSAISFAFCV